MVVLRDAGQVHEIALQQLDLAHEARRLHDAVGGGQHVGGDVYRHHRSYPPLTAGVLHRGFAFHSPCTRVSPEIQQTGRAEY